MEGGDEDGVGHEYAWEGIFDRTWEAVEEGADGTLHSSINQRWQREGRSAVHVGVKRGVMRCLFVIIDCSRHAGDSDIEMKPSRLAVMQDVATDFVNRFFDLNPVSSLAVLITRNAKAEALTPLSCNARQHVQAIRALSDTSGEASLQNALELARESLASVASFVSREVMLFSSSLTTCDPGDLHATVAQLSQSRVRCSVRSFGREQRLDRGLHSGPRFPSRRAARLLPPLSLVLALQPSAFRTAASPVAARPSRTMPFYAKLRHAMPCHAMRCHATLCNAMLYHISTRPCLGPPRTPPSLFAVPLAPQSMKYTICSAR